MYFTTVPELTNNEYNELRFSASNDTPIQGVYIQDLCRLLGKCGIDITNTTVYDENVEAAVKEFQNKVGMTANGILTNECLYAMRYYEYKISDYVDDDLDLEDENAREKSDSPHYNPFFDTDKFRIHRLNHKDIKIILGNNSIVKTIKDVFMRSVSVEVDTSGNPVSEVYEFVARDIKESDEISDITKYVGEEPTASSDIKYIYNFKETGSSNNS